MMSKDLSLLASAVDMPDSELSALKEQFASPSAQALQLLKLWQKNIGGTRKELYELIELFSSDSDVN